LAERFSFFAGKIKAFASMFLPKNEKTPTVKIGANLQEKKAWQKCVLGFIEI
jgi:hypothetical protein